MTPDSGATSTRRIDSGAQSAAQPAAALLPWVHWPAGRLWSHPLSVRPEPGKDLMLTHKIRTRMGLFLALSVDNDDQMQTAGLWAAHLATMQRMQDQMDSVQEDIHLTHTGPHRRLMRSARAVLVMPSCCACGAPDEDRHHTCGLALMQHCPALAPPDCFARVLASRACQAAAGSSNYKLSFFAGMRRAAEVLRTTYGWSNLSVISAPAAYESDVCRMGSARHMCGIKEENEARLEAAEVIIADVQDGLHLLPQYPRARFAILDTSDSGTLHPLLAAAPRLLRRAIAAVLKPHVLRPRALHNGALLANASHLAHIAGTADLAGFQEVAPVQLEEAVLARVRLGLNHAYRLRYFLDCGGQAENARFAGFFAQNSSNWHPAPLHQRPIDVSYFPHADIGAGSRAARQALQQHRRQLAAHLRYIQAAMPSLRFSQGPKYFAPQTAVVTLLNSKVFISPYGAGEWTHLDFQAIMCGCLVLKPGARYFSTYPSVFVPDDMVLDADVEWTDLQEKLQFIFQDMVLAQFMATRSSQRLLEFADVHRYAGDLDLLLGDVMFSKEALRRSSETRSSS